MTTPATKATRTIEALKFFLPRARWKKDLSKLISPRVQAVQQKNSDRKQVAKEAPELTCEMVLTLEGIVLNQRELPEMRVVIGFILFVLYTRERVADAARIVVEPFARARRT